jgi:hypothetical protein
MKPADQRAVLISAIAGGIAAGALLAAKRPQSSDELPALTAPEPAVKLPAVRETPELPVIYEARLETPKSRRWLAWLCAPAALCLGIPFALSERPQIAVAAPPALVAGTAGTIAYSTSGSGTLNVTVDSGAYHHALRFTQRVGTIDVPASATRAGTDVLATMNMRGAFGSQAQVLRIPVRAAVRARTIAPDVPVIRDVVLSKTSARGGELIYARYDTNAAGGSLRMTDASGVTWLVRPVHGNGVATIAVPRMHADTPFIVAVQAQRGGRSVTASAGFVALAVSPPRASGAGNLDAAPASFSVPTTVRSGATLAIPVPRAYAQATVALSSADGTAMLAPAMQTQHRVLLHVPVVTSAQSAFATLSYQRGKVKETLIRRVTIEP